MSHDDGRICRCVVNHHPYPLELNIHHIQPKAMGGSDDPDNLVDLDPTTHVNVHELLRLLMRDGFKTYYQVGLLYDVPVNRYAYQIALLGHRRIRAAVTP